LGEGEGGREKEEGEKKRYPRPPPPEDTLRLHAKFEGTGLCPKFVALLLAQKNSKKKEIARTSKAKGKKKRGKP